MCATLQEFGRLCVHAEMFLDKKLCFLGIVLKISALRNRERMRKADLFWLLLCFILSSF